MNNKPIKQKLLCRAKNISVTDSICRLKYIRSIAALLSLITFFIAVHTDNPINKDGILYLQTAEAFTNFGWHAAIESYSWPFYSILIAWTAELTHLSFEYSAYMLNAALLIVIITTFITIIGEIGGSPIIQFFGAVIILSHPQLNHYCSFIIRGFGYWAFSLLSLLCLMRYYRNLRWRYAFGWGIYAGLGTLFRIEGAVLCCLTPLVLMLRSDTGPWKRLGHTLKAYTFHIICLCAFVIFWISVPDQECTKFGRIIDLWDQLQNGFMALNANLLNTAAIISQIVLHEYSKNRGLTMAISGLAGIYTYSLIATLWPFHALLCAHAIFKRMLPPAGGAKKALVCFTVLNLLVPAIFLGQKLFVSYRFLMPAGLSLLLWTPFSLHYIFQHRRDGQKRLGGNRLLFFIVSFMVLIMFVYAFIPPKQSKAYITSAGKWLKHNMPQDAKLYGNTKQLAYYSQRQLIWWDADKETLKTQWGAGDYIALKIRNKNYQNLIKRSKPLKLQVINTFSNKEGDKIIVFRVQKKYSDIF